MGINSGFNAFDVPSKRGSFTLKKGKINPETRKVDPLTTET
jgi:hypothetical protein